MSGSFSSDSYSSRVTANFHDGARQFSLPTGATFADLADRINRLGLQCKAAPLTISVEFGTAFSPPFANANARTGRSLRLN